MNSKQQKQMRKEFEKATQNYYEGDFAKYDGDTGDYVSAQQQDDFMMFCSGFQAAYTPTPDVEVVARALARIEAGNHGKHGIDDVPAFIKEYIEGNWWRFKEEAQAAIDAIFNKGE